MLDEDAPHTMSLTSLPSGSAETKERRGHDPTNAGGQTGNVRQAESRQGIVKQVVPAPERGLFRVGKGTGRHSRRRAVLHTACSNIRRLHGFPGYHKGGPIGWQGTDISTIIGQLPRPPILFQTLGSAPTHTRFASEGL